MWDYTRVTLSIALCLISVAVATYAIVSVQSLTGLFVLIFSAMLTYMLGMIGLYGDMASDDYWQDWQ